VRINEIASAEEQIELWKLVSNSVWQSLQQQQQQEKNQKAQAEAKKKTMLKGNRLSTPTRTTVARPPPKIALPVKPKPPSTTAKQSGGTQNQPLQPTRFTAQQQRVAPMSAGKNFPVSNQNQGFLVDPVTPSK
jgi:hypothetical protein